MTAMIGVVLHSMPAVLSLIRKAIRPCLRWRRASISHARQPSPMASVGQ